VVYYPHINYSLEGDAMYLRKVFDKRSNKTYLSIAHTYRGENGKPKIKTIESLGSVEDLQKKFDDPIAHFTKVVSDMEEQRVNAISATVTIDMREQLPRGTRLRKNFGYALFSKIYHELGIDRFLRNAGRHEKHQFNTESMMRLLLYSRLIEPASKRASFLNKDYFFEDFKIDLPDVYSALTHFDKISDALQQHLHEQVVEQYNRDTKLVYYDVTNYYYESEVQDELRRKGCGKQGKRTPLVQMGLLMDRESLPIMYKIFPGNTHDSQTLIPMLAQVKKKYKTKRIISVADKGLNSGDNIAFNTALGDGYIFSKSVRGASIDFKAWVTDQTGYKEHGEGYRYKSKVVPDANIQINIERPGGKLGKKTLRVEQKWVAFYSEKYAVRAKRKRAETVAKAQDMIKNPSKYKGVLDYGAAGYVKNIKVNKETGEILNAADVMYIDNERIAEEEKYDGYYALVTSELDDTAEHIINTYRGLWRIEETFKISKSVLSTRPIYLQTENHINAHMLICFIALLIGRIIERRLNGMYTFQRIVETLQKVECTNVSANIWTFDFADDVTDEMNRVFGMVFGRKHMYLQEIKKFFAQTKKASPCLQI
jgi:transposase